MHTLLESTAGWLSPVASRLPLGVRMLRTLFKPRSKLPRTLRADRGVPLEDVELPPSWLDLHTRPNKVVVNFSDLCVLELVKLKYIPHAA
jgi:hypothetical protein